MKLAIVGVTGLVGSVMLEVLEKSNLPITQFIPAASANSKGKTIQLRGKTYEVVTIEEALAFKPDVALFSAGANTSKEWAEKFANIDCFVIDNSSAWRMETHIPLVVPEVNADILNKHDKIIANPNCSTIQMVVALYPLHLKYGIKRLVISTYQSFTGTGVKAVNQYEAEKSGRNVNGEAAYPHAIFENCIPQCDLFLDNDYTKEEMKLVNETRKIMRAPDIAITATAVRIPVHGGHSESVNVEFYKTFDLEDVKTLLKESPGIIVQDDKTRSHYPMPLTAKNKDEVFVGRIRRDESIENGLNLWIVADNLRKGAATNTVQIVEYLMKKQLIHQPV